MRFRKNLKVYLIDNALQNYVGHDFHYADSLYRYAVKHNIEFRVLGHKNVSPLITHVLPVEPIFRHEFHTLFYSKIPRGVLYLDFLRANFEFYRDLNTALRGKTNRDCVLFAPMVDHRQMLAWAWWLRSRPPECSPTVVLMFRFSYFHIKRNTFLSRPEILAKLGFKALEKTATRHRIRIVTDSERLADEYRGMTKLPLEIFPIPHTENISQIKEPNAGISPKGNLRFVFLGDAREEKGFPLLVSAINSLIKQNKMQGIKFIIQCHIGSHHHAPMLRFRRLLEKTEPAGVQVLKDFLEIEAYYRLLRSADIVVLPYSGKKYYARTSGPMAEAFAAGKPVIVTDNTWMSEQLRRFGSGVTFPDGSVAGLSRAIRETCDRYPELSARAQANRSAWIEFHNPGVFFRMLLPDKAF